MPLRPFALALLALATTAAAAPALAAPSTSRSLPARSVVANGAPAQYVYQPVAPARILDTRSKLGGAPATAGSTIHLQVAGRAGVPTTGVGAVVIKITALSSPQGGYLTAWADGAAQPNTASVNFSTGHAAGNLAVVPLGTDGRISIRNGAAGTVNITGDVSGYYTAVDDDTLQQGAFVPLPPSRVLDTRKSLGGAPPAAGTTIDLQITGTGGVPTTGVSAVVINLTALSSPQGGYLTAFPKGGTRPNTASVNFPTGHAAGNLAVVPLGTDGRISIRNGGAGTVNVTGDISGYYLAPATSAPTYAGALVPLAPARLLDTRKNLGGAPAAAGGIIHLQVAGKGGVPVAGVGAVVVNVTALSSPKGGYLTAYADGATPPTTATVNFPAGQAVGTLGIVPVGPDGKISIRNGAAGTVNVTADVSGYFLTSPPVIDPDAGGLSTVSCPTSTFCIAVDPNGSFVRWNGAGWSAPARAVPAAVSNETEAGLSLYSVSCVSSTFCMAGDSNGNILRYNGTTWTVDAGAFIYGANNNALSCVSTTFCAGVVGRSALTYNGTGWSAATALGDNDDDFTLTSVSCVSSTFCVAADDAGEVFTYNGTTWSGPVQALSDLGGQDGHVSCVSTTFCVAVRAAYASTFNGATWSDYKTPSAGIGSDALTAVSCYAGNTCVVGTRSGDTLTLTGATSARTKPADTVGDTVGISCPTAAFCASVDYYGGATTRVGGKWGATTIVDQQTGDLTGLSCTAATNCVAVDQAGNYVRFTGSAWTAPRTVQPNVSLNAVACTSATVCVAVGRNEVTNQGVIAQYNGSTWTVRTSAGYGTLAQLSCASSAFCLAVTENHQSYLTYNPTTKIATTAQPASLGESVTCVSATRCWSGGDVYTGSTWTYDETVPNGTITCAGASYCVSPLANGGLSFWNGTTWTTKTTTGTWGPGSLVSCATTTFCLLADENTPGYAAVYNGTTAAPPVLYWPSAPTDDGPRAVDCPAAGFCVAIGQERAVYYN